MSMSAKVTSGKKAAGEAQRWNARVLANYTSISARQEANRGADGDGRAVWK